MHDIDFDEIDRAINSAKNPRQAAAVAATEPTVAPVAIPEPTTAVVSEPATISTTHAPVSVTPTAPASSPAARRSSGRFMDVVHPSSDMRPAGTPRLSISPSPSFQKEETAREQVAERPQPALETPAPAAPIIDPVTPEPDQSGAFHWPDPIDLQETAQQDEAPEVVETLPVPDDEPAVVAEEDDDDQDIEDIISGPLESPFLTDAKVEKRPLGAFSGPDSDLPLLEDFPEPTQQPETPVTPEVVEVAAAPEELIDEVVSEKTHKESLEAEHEIPRELHSDLLMLDTHSTDEPAPVLAAAAPVSTPIVAEESVGPTSITQQYKEQPSTVSSQEPGAIYDTATYHQALTHPPKKTSSVLIIVWIVAIILVGVGIALGFTYFVLPMIG